MQRNNYYRCRRYDDVTKMQYLDINMWMVGDILLKADRMSMANSLELRVPFLDKEVFKLRPPFLQSFVATVTILSSYA